MSNLGLARRILQLCCFSTFRVCVSSICKADLALLLDLIKSAPPAKSGGWGLGNSDWCHFNPLLGILCSRRNVLHVLVLASQDLLGREFWWLTSTARILSWLQFLGRWLWRRILRGPVCGWERWSPAFIVLCLGVGLLWRYFWRLFWGFNLGHHQRILFFLLLCISVEMGIVSPLGAPRICQLSKVFANWKRVKVKSANLRKWKVQVWESESEECKFEKVKAKRDFPVWWMSVIVNDNLHPWLAHLSRQLRSCQNKVFSAFLFENVSLELK